MSDYWMCLWVSDFLSRWNLDILFSTYSIYYLLCSFCLNVWERYLYVNFKFVRWRETNLNFNVLLQLLYLLLQSVVDSMVVAVAFPDFSGFLAFRAPNIWLPKSGSNGSFLELIFLVLTWIRGICLLVHKVLSTTLGSDPVRRIWLCPWFRSTSWFWISVLFLTLTSSR